MSVVVSVYVSRETLDESERALFVTVSVYASLVAESDWIPVDTCTVFVSVCTSELSCK